MKHQHKRLREAAADGERKARGFFAAEKKESEPVLRETALAMLRETP